MAIISRSLGRGVSRFIGFESDRVDHLLSECDTVMDRQPRVESIDEAVYLPRRQALYTPKGRRIDSTAPTFLEPQIRRIGAQQAKLERENAEKCPEDQPIPDRLERSTTVAMLLGTIIPHFGHFLTDSMARLWFMDQISPDVSILNIGWVREFGRGYERLVAEALGLQDRLVTPIGPTVFTRVINPWPAFQLARRAYAVADTPHRKVASVLQRAVSTRTFDRPVYLSRSRLGDGHRRLEGEVQLQTRLEHEGFEVVHPETIPLTEQITLFQSGRPIVGVIGSALHPLLFRTTEAPAKLAILCDSYVHQRFLMQDALKSVETTYIRCMTHVDADTAARPLAEQELELDVEAALAGLSEAGFLGGRAQA